MVRSQVRREENGVILNPVKLHNRILTGGACLLIAITTALCVQPREASVRQLFSNKPSRVSQTHARGEPNTLTPAERVAGWRLLFDGKTPRGWRGFHKATFPEGRWVIEDGCIHHLAGEGKQSADGGDIITVEQFENFELFLEWKIAPGGNSGIKYFVDENFPPTGSGGLGFEVQILDDERHPDAKLGRNGNRTAGSLYDLIPASSNKILKPVGEFNEVRLVVRGNHIEHWLNGVKVVEYERESPELKKLIAESKYKDIPTFGTRSRGHILLQDHGDAVWFRNIKIRELHER